MENEKKLYMYVYRMILSDIYNGKYSLNEKLPSLPDLCTQYDVGRNTVRSALLQLQEDGYVVAKRGVQAIVSFDLGHFETQLKYKQRIKDSEQMIIHIYETMGKILPDITVTCFQVMTPEQFEDLEVRVKNFPSHDIKNEAGLIQELYNIYLHAFSVLNNSLLNDLFITFMSSIYQPIQQNDDTSSLFRRNVKTIQATLQFLLRCAKAKNYFLVKNIVAMMCNANEKLSVKYIDELCQGMKVKDQKDFIWVSQHNQDYLYVKVVLKIMRAIQKKEFVKGKTLPSIAQLSLDYEVSEKTTRKALEVLREIQVIETINGVGSKVIVDERYDQQILINSPRIQDNIKIFYDSLELIALIFPIILPEIIRSSSKDDIKAIQDMIESDSYPTTEYLYDYICKQVNPCMQVVLEELKSPIGWNMFVGYVINDHTIEFKEKQNELFEAFMNKDVKKVCQISEQLFRTSSLLISQKIK